MSPEDYNPYNIMNDTPSEQYITNNPYEYKPSYNEDVMILLHSKRLKLLQIIS